MPVTIQPATLKYKNNSGVFLEADCLRGPAGDPTQLIDDTAGAGDTDKVWSADKTLDEIMAVSPVLPVFTMGEQNEVQCNMTFAEIAEAIQAGKCTMAAFGNEQFYYYLTLSSFAQNDEAVFSLLLGTGDGAISPTDEADGGA